MSKSATTSRATLAQPVLQPVQKAKLDDNGIDVVRFERMCARIQADINADLYPGAAIAMARHGELLAELAFGAKEIGADAVAADSKTLWLLYSQTKPLTSCAIWLLAERGQLSFHEPVATYIPEFAQHGKADVTVQHVLTHQGGFPSANVPARAWEDSASRREAICDFRLEWQPGSRVSYHGYAGHWVQSLLIEAISGMDYRQFMRTVVLEPLGMSNTFIGVPDSELCRVACSYERTESGEHIISADFSSDAFLRAGVPGAGGYATASDITKFYQMLLGRGELNGHRLLSQRMVEYVTSNHTGDRIDEFFGMPMHRGLGVHLRGTTPTIRGLSSIASPRAYGHGGVGTSYSWGDPDSGVSFTYLTNSRMPEPAHSRRLEEIMTMAHACIRSL